MACLHSFIHLFKLEVLEKQSEFFIILKNPLPFMASAFSSYQNHLDLEASV